MCVCVCVCVSASACGHARARVYSIVKRRTFHFTPRTKFTARSFFILVYIIECFYVIIFFFTTTDVIHQCVILSAKLFTLYNRRIS